MKYLLIFVFIFFQKIVSATEPLEEREYILNLVQEVRYYFKTEKGCKPRYSFKERRHLVEELLSIKETEVKSILYRSANELGIFLERVKSGRQGLTIEIYLNEGRCDEFDIFEIMH
ncbi:hypothetical protein [Pseudoalteromonas obscura]|uniref:Uncharacterized protein n=1 Tax=Pseudoalteromonas obscura TaxID=3048491 RepID=A0ABT7ETF1_9GAMM|nr:hypothetical protein [Pseudoalteromonas sp. P94(2023)]MDK2598326.1 hypothetical protein [Pseudoalteromonas sp. P94(2023)]